MHGIGNFCRLPGAGNGAGPGGMPPSLMDAPFYDEGYGPGPVAPLMGGPARAPGATMGAAAAMGGAGGGAGGLKHGARKHSMLDWLHATCYKLDTEQISSQAEHDQCAQLAKLLQCGIDMFRSKQSPTELCMSEEAVDPYLMPLA